MEIIYRHTDIKHIWELNFKGSRYNVTFHKYTDCINILEIKLICDVLEVTKKEPTFINRNLRDYETEFKQIKELIKKEVL